MNCILHTENFDDLIFIACLLFRRRYQSEVDFQSDAQTNIAIVRVVVVERTRRVHIPLVVRVAGIRRLTEYDHYYIVPYSVTFYFILPYRCSSDTIQPSKRSPIS